MQRNPSERGAERRINADRDASQPIDGQPRADDDESDNELQKPDDVPSFLTARELQARDPAKPSRDGDATEDETASDPVAGKGKARKR